MPEPTFTLAPRVGFGWCVVGPDGESYAWFMTESEAQSHAKYLEWVWAGEVGKNMHRRPRHMWAADELGRLQRFGYAGACAHVLAGHLTWTVEEVAGTLAELRDEFDEIEQVDTCGECGVVYRTR